MTVGAYPGTVQPADRRPPGHRRGGVATGRPGPPGPDRVDRRLWEKTRPGRRSSTGWRCSRRSPPAAPGWRSRVTDRQLIAEVAAGYDAVVVGVDKWLQIVDPAWYGGSAAARDAGGGQAAPGPGRWPGPASAAGSCLPAAVCSWPSAPSSTGSPPSAARAGRRDWMAAEAAAHDDLTGAWTACRSPPSPDRATPGRAGSPTDQARRGGSPDRAGDRATLGPR